MNKPVLAALLASSLSVILFLSGCVSTAAGEPPTITPASPPADTLETEATLPAAVPDSIAEAERKAGYEVKVPDLSLLEDYALQSAEFEETTRSVCLQFRHTSPSGDSVLFIAQGQHQGLFDMMMF